MSTYTRRVIIVIDAAVRDKATNDLAQKVDPAGGDNAFNVPLYPAGGPQASPTHYWCSWAMTDDEDTNIKALRTALAAADRSKVRMFNGNTRTPESVLAELGLETHHPMEVK